MKIKNVNAAAAPAPAQIRPITIGDRARQMADRWAVNVAAAAPAGPVPRPVPFAEIKHRSN
jgi:hypothetical protein